MSAKPNASSITEDEYWRMFHAVRGDIETAIKSNSAYWKVNDLARDDPKVLQKYNQHAHFWTLNSYALQSTFFISFGRIFDERKDVFSIQKLVDATIKHPVFFSRPALRLRKRKHAQVHGADPQWLIDYVNAAWEPTTKDLQVLKAALTPHYHKFKAIYQPIRHTYFAHRGTAPEEAVHALFRKTLIVDVSEILRFLHTLIWSIDQMAINGRTIDLFDVRDYENWVKNLDTQIEAFVRSLS
jgi:AbiU2